MLNVSFNLHIFLTPTLIVGAKFTMHFISSFGHVVHVEFISSVLALVFCTQGVIEVWKLDVNDPSSLPELIEFISVEQENKISCVEQLPEGNKSNLQSGQDLDTRAIDDKVKFFLGFEDGAACTITIQFLDIIDDKVPTKVKTTVHNSQLISSAPVKNSVLDSLENLVLVSIWDSEEGNHIVALNGDLQIVWKQGVSNISNACSEKVFHSF
jgi:hypothetical protein